MWAVVALSIGLAMDATAVAAARGLARGAPRDIVVLPLMFGGFQAGMAALGWLLGDLGGTYVASWNTWIAFGLLVLIGLKMIVDGLRVHQAPTAEEERRTTALVYVGLALATSIDAAAAGVALPLLEAPIWLALASIGGITAGFTVAGYIAGNALGSRFGGRLTILGGVVLLVIAAKLALY